MNNRYPFSAIVGQELLKKALLMNMVNPRVGGILLCGEKGTGKSTIIRSLKGILDAMEIMEIPLNTTMDRLLGSIDMEKAILEGKIEVSNSILMDANGNILYVDEINLLKDDIINALLEICQSKVHQVEREGISFTHESSFILIGTMNPEEGHIRSQLLDRFGFYVKVQGEEDLYDRVEIIKRRLEYEESPIAFMKKWEDEDNRLKNKIKNAKEIINEVELPEYTIKRAAEIALEYNCSGHRADLVMIEGAKALAALDGRKSISVEDLYEVAKLALPHRVKDHSSQLLAEENDDETSNEENKGDSNEEIEDKESQNGDIENLENPRDKQNNIEDDNINEEQLNNIENSSEDLLHKIGETFEVRDLNIKPISHRERKGSGRRSKARTSEMMGRYVRSVMNSGEVKDMAFDATLRAAAPYQRYRDKKGLSLAIERTDIRQKVREKRTGATILFVVDASGSMGAKKRMEAVKGATISILTDAYEKRDSIGLIGFRKNNAELLLNITRSVDLAYKKLRDLPVGGRTPLSLGLYKGYEVLKGALRKDPHIIPILVLVSDGRGNISMLNDSPLNEALKISNQIFMEGIQSIVIDTEMDFIKLNQSKKIAEALGASYYSLNELRADEIVAAIKENIIEPRR